MPTARELLEQADALMRRNRMPGGEPKPRAAEIPVLTEAVDPSGRTAGAATPFELEAGVASVSAEKWKRPDDGSTTPAMALDDVPVLTDVVEEIEAPTISESFDDDPSQWDMEPDRAGRAAPGGTRGRTGTAAPEDVARTEARRGSAQGASGEAAHASGDSPAAPDEPGIAQIQGDDVDELALDELEAASAPPSDPASTVAAADSTTAPAAHRSATTSADDDGEWEALAEEIRIQVLQRIDMFTDTGLHEQLTTRLQPIVARASAELVATINQQVGQLLRTYVAEAVEHEIEKWRHGGG